MMKFYMLNGSPRVNWNTSKLLEKVKEGISDTLKDRDLEFDVEVINLFQLDFKGCMSCFNCKLIDGPFYGQCPINDDLKELLPKLWESDGIVIGSPVYFSDVTGQTRNILERLVFPKLVYGSSTIAPKQMPTGTIYTMNATRDFAEKLYSHIHETMKGALSYAFKEPYTMSAYNTVQFDDYSKYENYAFNEEEKLKFEEENFPKELEEAYSMGIHIALDAIKIQEK